MQRGRNYDNKLNHLTLVPLQQSNVRNASRDPKRINHRNHWKISPAYRLTQISQVFFTWAELGLTQDGSPGRDESSLHDDEHGKWFLGTVVSLHKNKHNVKYYKCQFNTPAPKVFDYNSAETQTGIRNLADLRAMAKTPSQNGEDDESGSDEHENGSDSQISDERKDVEVPPKRERGYKV